MKTFHTDKPIIRRVLICMTILFGSILGIISSVLLIGYLFKK